MEILLVFMTLPMENLLMADRHPGGRPTKLNKAIIELAWTYIIPSYLVDGKIAKTVIDPNNFINYEGEDAPVIKAGYEMHGDIVPTIEGFAQYIGVSRETCYAWEREHKEFSDIMDGIRQRQGRMLINGALGNKFNPTISKLLLSSKHGYVEKSATDITTGGEKLSQPDEKLAAEFAEFMKEKR